MSLTVTLNLPDDLAQAVEKDARQKGVSIDELVRDTLAARYAQEAWETGEITEGERRHRHDVMLSREDVFGSEADRHWDTWTP